MTSVKQKNIIRDIYNNNKYLEENSDWHQQDSPYKAHLVHKVIKKNQLQFKSCVDLGCGAGLVTELLAAKFPESKFLGIDLAADTEPFWKQRTKLENLTYQLTNFVESNNVNDLVLCLDVFEHIEDYYGFLRDIRKNGKNFIFNIPLDMNAMKILSGGIKYAREEVGHLHYFNEFTAKQTLIDCGYKIQDSFLSSAFLKVPPRNMRQAAILPLRILSLALGKSLSTKIFGGQSLVILAGT